MCFAVSVAQIGCTEEVYSYYLNIWTIVIQSLPVYIYYIIYPAESTRTLDRNPLLDIVLPNKKKLSSCTINAYYRCENSYLFNSSFGHLGHMNSILVINPEVRNC